MSITPLGKPVVPLENGIVARSSKTLRFGASTAKDRPDLRIMCHCEALVFEQSMTTALVLYPALPSLESNGTNSGVHIQRSALFILATCSSSPYKDKEKTKILMCCRLGIN